MSHTTHTPFIAASLRAVALGLAVIVTLFMFAGMGRIADRQHADVMVSQAAEAPTQVVVVSGHRLPRG